jgi:hypothetical protein
VRLFDEALAGAARWPQLDRSPEANERVELAVRRLRRRRGRRLSPELLAEVIEVVDENPLRPAAAVAEQWDVGLTTAAYWVKRAREEDE